MQNENAKKQAEKPNENGIKEMENTLVSSFNVHKLFRLKAS